MDSLDYILGILLIAFYIYKSLYIDLSRLGRKEIKPRRDFSRGKRNGK